MLANKLTIALSAAVLSACLGSPGNAQASPEVLSAWADYAQTRTLEELLYRAVQDKSVSVLSAAHSEIVSKDLAAINHIQSLIEKGDTQAIPRISMAMSACHHAGVAIRLLIVIAYKKFETPGDNVVEISSEAAQRFAENMDLCERLSRKPAARRLIGDS